MEFKYTNATSVLHSIPCSISDEVRVVGDPDNAAYEWLIVRNGIECEHSDDAYGSSEVALRDGLIVYTEYGQ